jgi:hypothetical protein
VVNIFDATFELFVPGMDRDSMPIKHMMATREQMTMMMMSGMWMTGLLKKKW